MLASPMELLITSSVVILAVVLLRLVLRDRLSRQLRYALWLAVVLRLLVPLSPPAASSVMNLPAAERLAAFQPVRVEVFTGPETPADTLPEAPADGTLQEAAPARTMEPLALIWLAGAAVTGGPGPVSADPLSLRLPRAGGLPPPGGRRRWADAAPCAHP